MAQQSVSLPLTPLGESPSGQRTFLGHPIGLYTLFFTELWERFSFYGMKALLILYMLNHFVWSQEDASNVLRWYTGLVYLTPVFGGIIADKFLGAKRSVLIGGILIAAGHLCLAFEPLSFFYSGLVLLILGVGLLKPNVSTQVGSMYSPGDPRRDSAFTIFYMGINAGAFMGPLLCDWLRIHYGWHYGFGAAAIGMFLGLIVYSIGQRWVYQVDQNVDLEHKGRTPAENGSKGDASHTSNIVQSQRVLALVIICVFAVLFWVCFEQMANAMTVWADQHTDLQPFDSTVTPATVEGEPPPASAGNFMIGAGQLQSVNPGYILLFGALFSWLWIWLDKRKKQPSSPGKMCIAVFLMASAWGVMILGGRGEEQPSSAPLAKVPGDIKLEKYGATRLSYDESSKTLKMKGVLPRLDRIRLLGESAPESYRKKVDELAEKAAATAKESPEGEHWRVSVTFTDDPLPTIDVNVLDTVVPEDYEKTVEKLVQKARGRRSKPVTVKYPAVAALPEVEESMLPKSVQWNAADRKLTADPEFSPADEGKLLAAAATVQWNPTDRTLTATARLPERNKLIVLAAGADPDFREAVDSIYKQSSLYRIAVWWLFLHYMLATMGELCLSPVGLSLVTKLAPPKNVGLFMGLWFLTTGAIANFVAHSIGGEWGTMTPTQYFSIFAIISIGATLLMLVLIRMLKRMMHGVH